MATVPANGRPSDVRHGDITPNRDPDQEFNACSND
jgi:hypothetical protein